MNVIGKSVDFKGKFINVELNNDLTLNVCNM